MTQHVRAQIRKNVAEILTGLQTTAANPVFVDPSSSLTIDDMPCLCVTLGNETVESRGSRPRSLRRTAMLDIICLIAANTDKNAHDVLDQALAEVEIALANNLHLNGTAQLVTLLSTDLGVDESGEVPIVVGVMHYEVVYATSEGFPNVSR